MRMPVPVSSLSSFRKQQLLVEFSSLRHACLEGVLVSLTPGDPSLWVGVIFVRKGPYSSAVLRFQILFPPLYPSLPPLVTFSTDVFHPLLTPLTTYTYTTGSSDTDTVSATDDERLPPGGFSLRHGFPQWFGRARKSAVSSRDVSGSSETTTVNPPAQSTVESHDSVPSVVTVLSYICSTFQDERVLDSIPAEAAANAGAFHAWKSLRAAELQSPDSGTAVADAAAQGSSTGASVLGRNRQPGQWNWEGVWEERVNKAIKASMADSALFGGAAGDDLIRFLDADDETASRMKSRLEMAIVHNADHQLV